MPKITKLTQQKRHPDRYSVYLDGAFAFGLSSLDVSNAGLREGQSILDTEVDQWVRLSEEGAWYNKAIGLISYRRRSRHELDDYFRRQQVDPELANKVIDHLVAIGLVDDQAFASAWVADRQLLRPRSTRMLQVELMKKGIARDVIKAVLDELEPDSELDQLVSLIEIKRRQSRYEDPHKLMGYLARQGYGYDAIKKALARLDDES